MRPKSTSGRYLSTPGPPPSEPIAPAPTPTEKDLPPYSASVQDTTADRTELSKAQPFRYSSTTSHIILDTIFEEVGASQHKNTHINIEKVRKNVYNSCPWFLSPDVALLLLHHLLLIGVKNYFISVIN